VSQQDGADSLTLNGTYYYQPISRYPRFSVVLLLFDQDQEIEERHPLKKVKLSYSYSAWNNKALLMNSAPETQRVLSL